LKTVTILGAGAMGSALAFPISDRGHRVILWNRSPQVLDIIKAGQPHPKLGVRMPENVELRYRDELGKAVEEADYIIIAVSSAGVKGVTEAIKPYVKDGQVLINVAKGLIEFNGEVMLIPEAIKRILRDKKVTIAAVTGPSLAKDVAARRLTVAVYSSEKIGVVKELKKEFETDYYRIQVTDDIIGAEASAVLKNVYAIGIGWLDGLAERMGVEELRNAKAAFFTIALKEMAKIVKLLGGSEKTVIDQSGLGDLYVTVKGGRNGLFGRLLGKGLTPEQALNKIREMGLGVVEGYENTRHMYALLKKLEGEGKVILEKELPFFTGICKVIYEGQKVDEAIEKILTQI